MNPPPNCSPILHTYHRRPYLVDLPSADGFRTISGHVNIPPSHLADYKVGAITIIALASSNLSVSFVFLLPKMCFDVPIAFDSVHEPESFLEATTRPGWQATMDMEMQSIHDNHAWEIIPLPPRCTPITTKWVYKMKKD